MTAASMPIGFVSQMIAVPGTVRGTILPIDRGSAVAHRHEKYHAVHSLHLLQKRFAISDATQRIPRCLELGSLEPGAKYIPFVDRGQWTKTAPIQLKRNVTPDSALALARLKQTGRRLGKCHSEKAELGQARA
jgi:hypothetical protein